MTDHHNIEKKSVRGPVRIFTGCLKTKSVKMMLRSKRYQWRI